MSWPKGKKNGRYVQAVPAEGRLPTGGDAGGEVVSVAVSEEQRPSKWPAAAFTKRFAADVWAAIEQNCGTYASDKDMCFLLWPFCAGFRPNLAPGPAPTGQARKMV